VYTGTITASGSDLIAGMNCTSTSPSGFKYNLYSNQAVSWVLEPSSGSGFEFVGYAPGTLAASVYLRATSLHGNSAALKAYTTTGNSALIHSKPIGACIPDINGEPMVLYPEEYCLSPVMDANWSVSGDFEITTPKIGVSCVTVKSTNHNGQTGMLTATVNGTQITQNIYSYYLIYPGVPHGVTYLCAKSVTYELRDDYYGLGYDANSVTWSCTSNLSLTGGNKGLSKTFNITGYGYATVTAAVGTSIGILYYTHDFLADPSCNTTYHFQKGGWDFPLTPYFQALENRSGSSCITAYPNPAHDILLVEIDADCFAQSGRVTHTYDVRLYDLQGNLLRQENTQGTGVEFNVAGLSNGIYVVHVSDGVNQKPEMMPVVVEH
jgi:hypothetical protein